MIIIMYEKCEIVTQMLLKFIPKGPIDNEQSLVKSMAWHRTCEKSLYEPMIA